MINTINEIPVPDFTLTRFGQIGKSSIRLGRFSYGFENVSIRQWGEGAALNIGSFCSIAGVSFVLGGNHRTEWITTYPFGSVDGQKEYLWGGGLENHCYTNGDINVGNDVWLGNNCTIMSGVSIGDGACVAANSHVVKDVGPYEVIGGNPAKFIRRRFNIEIIDQLLLLRWWDLPLEDIKNLINDLGREPTLISVIGMVNKYRSSQP